MNSVENQPQTRESTLRLFCTVIRPLISAAAIVLTGLFLIQFNETVTVKEYSLHENVIHSETLSKKKDGESIEKSQEDVARKYWDCISTRKSSTQKDRTCILTTLLSYMEKKQKRDISYNNKIKYYQTIKK